MQYAGMSNNSPHATRDNYLLSYGKDNDYYWWMWSMSPQYSYSSYAYEFIGYSSSGFSDNGVCSTGSVVRPVINLNAGTLASGNETKENPYIVD